jgi:uncharacterized protein YjdB
VLGLAALAADCKAQPMKIEIVDDDPSTTFNGPQESRQVQVMVLDADGAVIPKPSLRWYSVNPKIAEVTEQGLIVPKSDGRTAVVARSGYAQHELPVTVQFYGSVEPSQRSVSIPAGGVGHLTAVVKDLRGNPIEDAPLSWTSLDPNVLEVDENGTLIALAPGSATVRVRAKHLTAAVKVQITAPQEEPAS